MTRLIDADALIKSFFYVEKHDEAYDFCKAVYDAPTIDCEHCEVKEYSQDLEEECENLSEQNRVLIEAIKDADISEEDIFKAILLKWFRDGAKEGRSDEHTLQKTDRADQASRANMGEPYGRLSQNDIQPRLDTKHDDILPVWLYI